MAATHRTRTDRLTLAVNNLDPEHMDAGAVRIGSGRTAAEFAATVRQTIGARTRRYSPTIRTAITDDATTVALAVGVAMAGDPRHADESPTRIAQRAAWSAVEDALEDYRANSTTLAAGTGADLDSLTLDRAAPAITATRRPDWQALPETDQERLTIAAQHVSDDTRTILAAALTLPNDGRGWRTGRPSAAPILAATARRPSTGRSRAAMSRSIAAALAETAETIAAHDRQRYAATFVGTAHHGTYKRTPAAPHYAGRQTARTLARPDGPFTLALAAAQVVTYRPTPGMLGTPRTTPENGPATPVVVRTATGGTAVVVTEKDATTGEPITRRIPITEHQAHAILAGPTGRAYRATADDRAADAAAYSTTPGGPVRATSPTRKSRAAGAVGTSMVGRAARLDWGGRTDKRDAGRPSPGRWDAHSEYTRPYATLPTASPVPPRRPAATAEALADALATAADHLATATARPLTAAPWPNPIGPTPDPNADCHRHGPRRHCRGRH